jgi:hypothetical protein
LLVQNFFAIPCPTFRVTDAVAVGGLDETLWYTADWDFWLKLASVGQTVYSAEPLAFFRVHSASQTALRTVHASEMRQQLQVVLERHLSILDSDVRTRRSVQAAACAAIEINVALSALSHKKAPHYRQVVRAFRGLNSTAIWRVLRDSGIAARVGARVRAAIRHPAT